MSNQKKKKLTDLETEPANVCSTDSMHISSSSSYPFQSLDSSTES